MILIPIATFAISCFLLLFVGKFLIEALIRIARFLQWREFVVSFFIIALASSIPNFFVGIFSAIQGIPLLSFGDIVGSNVINLTLAIAIPVLISNGIQVKSKVAQKTSFFTMLCAILPLILLLDKKLSRSDGLLLILFFFIYVAWLFSKEERFKLVYDGENPYKKIGFKMFIIDIGRIVLGIAFLLIAAEGIVFSVTDFAKFLKMPLFLIGIFIVGVGSSLPEIYFSITSSKKGESWMVLGSLMGSIIILSTLVLGTVCLISPIEFLDFSPFAIACVFQFIGALFFFWFIRTDRKITRREGLILLGIFILFLTVEIFLR